MRFLPLIIIITFLSCKSIEKANPIEKTTENIVFTELSKGTNGNFTDKLTKVVTNQTDFNSIWTAAHERFSEQPKPPRIDFENKMIVLVAMGIQNSGGHTIEISSALESKSDIIINILETTPGTTCVSSDVMTFPYQIVELKKSEKQVVFKTSNKVYECEE
ncbi:MAG: protease complex subunit PrcB family protein [Flavobacteriales bacterium]|nr:protease complex subunit PrcB family protein [Flavobacteriales bacterium]